ncbi:MAG: M24 family metallopeptidase [Gemmatimonadetes bacterium]|nr:M24 family metallopeptidase [Gemmatimonadota bacterium]
MIGSKSDFRGIKEHLPEIQEGLRDAGLDGWLLYDLHARNPVAGELLGLGDMTRRYFALIPAEGEPTALMHGIETGPWEDWPWKRLTYVAWKTLDERLAALVGGRRLAMEISPGDAVPAIDYIPAGVAELVRAAGAELVPSADLITRFYARWSDQGLASHERASAILAETAREAFARAADTIRAGEELREGHLRRWVVDRLAKKGVGVGADSILANGRNAANPHYETGDVGDVIRPGDVILLDLWAKETPESIYADQTWMAILSPDVPPEVQGYWEAIRDARDAAVEFLQSEWKTGRRIQGSQVDDAARNVIRERGWGDHFIHRTGHSIDRETHGMGPNMDNLETRETRMIIPGVGFSIEPGIYVPGNVGLRTEINVFVGNDGPRVTTPDPQHEIARLLR